MQQKRGGYFYEEKSNGIGFIILSSSYGPGKQKRHVRHAGFLTKFDEKR